MSVIGLGGIHVASQSITPAEPAISEIDSSWSGETVRIRGEVVSSYSSGNNTFLNVGREHNITVVDFESEKNYETGEQVSVTGAVRIYRGTVEIVADSVRRT